MSFPWVLWHLEPVYTGLKTETLTRRTPMRAGH